MKQQLFTILLAVLLLTFFGCSTEQRLTKEQLLRQSIRELEIRFEERKLGRVVEYVSVSYRDEQGRSLRDIKRVIQLQLMRHKSLYVFSSISEINWIDDSNADVKITVAMAGKPIKSASILTSVRADMVKFNARFVLENEIYKVQSVIWSWAEPSDFF